MASDKGFPSKERETEREVFHDHVTAQPVREKQIAKDVVAHFYIQEIATDTAEAGSTTAIINATAHSAIVGDIISFTTGNLNTKEYRVIKVAANTIEVGEQMSEAPGNGDSFAILRHKYPKVDASGSLQVTSTPGPLQFRLDGSATEVIEDTINPSNNIPLPVKLTSVTGDINITAGDLNVQTSHAGANFDSLRIGDGTETLEINASGEAQVRDDDANTALSALLTELQAKADLTETQPVSAASLPLPTGAATEATLASLDGKDFATQTTLAALLTELQAKADLAETQPVSASSLPLPTGAATEATLASIDGKDFATQTTLAALLTELQAKADLTETQPVSAASLPLPAGASTEAKQDDVITQLTSIAAEDFATETSLAALNAKVTAVDTTGKATEAKQDDIITELQSLVASAGAGLDVQEFARIDYTSTNVTTAAYVELVAATSSDISKLQIFDSSGQTLVLAIGAAASEVDKLYIFPGGNGDISVNIPSGSRISLKAVSATADAGEISVNLLG